MRTGLIAKKIGMTRVFDQNRKHNSVTVLEIPSAKVLKLRKTEKDGYNALVIGSETFSRILDWDDRSTCVLFGDGAGAVILQSTIWSRLNKGLGLK